MLADDDHRNWDTRINEALLEIRTRVSRATGFKPVDLLYNHGFRVFYDHGEANDSSQEEEEIRKIESCKADQDLMNAEVQEIVKRYKDVAVLVRDAVEEQSEKENLRRKASYDKRHYATGRSVKVGEVYLNLHKQF